jgi:hypothetical protein
MCGLVIISALRWYSSTLGKEEERIGEKRDMAVEYLGNNKVDQDVGTEGSKLESAVDDSRK